MKLGFAEGEAKTEYGGKTGAEGEAVNTEILIVFK